MNSTCCIHYSWTVLASCWDETEGAAECQLSTDIDGKCQKHNLSSNTRWSYCKLYITVPNFTYNTTDSQTTHIYIFYEWTLFYLFQRNVYTRSPSRSSNNINRVPTSTHSYVHSHTDTFVHTLVIHGRLGIPAISVYWIVFYTAIKRRQMSPKLRYEVSGSSAQCDSPELKCGVHVPYRLFEYHTVSS